MRNKLCNVRVYANGIDLCPNNCVTLTVMSEQFMEIKRLHPFGNYKYCSRLRKIFIYGGSESIFYEIFDISNLFFCSSSSL